MPIVAYVGSAVLAAVLLAFIGLIVLGSLRARLDRATSGWVLVDGRGQRVGAQVFDDAAPFGEGLAPVELGGRWGFVDRTGAWVIEPTYDLARPFDGSGRAFVRSGPRWGLIDRDGSTVMEPMLLHASRFNEWIAVGTLPVGVKQKSTMSALDPEKSSGLLRPDGSWLRPPADREDPERWLGARGPAEGRVAAQGVDRGWGLFDLDGRPLVEARFAQLGEPSEGRVPARRGKAWGYIDGTGAWVIAPQWSMAGPFAEGVAVVRGDGGAWLIRRDGERIAGPFEALKGPSEGRVAARVDGRWGFIDTGGAWVIEPRFVDVGFEGFRDGYAQVARSAGAGKEWAWVDGAGQPLGEVWPQR